MNEDLIRTNIKYLNDQGLNIKQVSGSLTRYYMDFDSIYSLIKTVKKLAKDGALGEYIPEKNLTKLPENFNKESGLNYKSLEEVFQDMSDGRVPKEYIEAFEASRQQTIETDKIRNLSNLARSNKRKRKFKDSGSELDIDRLLSGDENHWSQMTRGSKDKICVLGYNGTCAKGETAIDSMTRGIQCLIAADCLQLASISTEIWFNECYTILGSDIHVIIRVKLKDAYEQLDWQRILCSGIEMLSTSLCCSLQQRMMYGIQIVVETWNNMCFYDYKLSSKDFIVNEIKRNLKKFSRKKASKTSGFLHNVDSYYQQVFNYDILIDAHKGDNDISDKLEEVLNEKLNLQPHE